MPSLHSPQPRVSPPQPKYSPTQSQFSPKHARFSPYNGSDRPRSFSNRGYHTTRHQSDGTSNYYHQSANVSLDSRLFTFTWFTTVCFSHIIPTMSTTAEDAKHLQSIRRKFPRRLAPILYVSWTRVVLIPFLSPHTFHNFLRLLALRFFIFFVLILNSSEPHQSSTCSMSQFHGILQKFIMYSERQRYRNRSLVFWISRYTLAYNVPQSYI